MLLIQPLQEICKVVNDTTIEHQLRSFPLDQQKELYDLLKEIMLDEISFVLKLYKAIDMQRQGAH